MMLQRTLASAAALFMIVVSPLATASPEQGQSPAPAAKAKKPVKTGAAAAKGGAKKAPRYGPGMIPPAMAGHRPPTPPPSHNQYEVPQPKSLADTPDTVLNSKVRASLMSALTAPREEDITPQTSKGVVTLTGSVKTKALKARAEQVATHVHGVRAVRNRLIVK